MERTNGIERLLRESQERFQSAFHFAPIGIALIALDGRWLEVNPALCELVGYAKEELLRKTFQELTHPDEVATDLGFAQQLLSGDLRTYKIEKRYVHKQGASIWILLRVSLVRATSGQPLYFIAQLEDITERRRTEEELEQVRQNLAARVHELEEALAEVKTLQGILPICSYCKNIRNDKNFWMKVEDYLTHHTEALFSHAICPTCYEKLLAEFRDSK
jgi:PAS domain S-box-containing protein